MKERIIEIVEIGQPQSLIQRENAPITELIKTDMLIEELNEQFRLYNVVGSALLSDLMKEQQEIISSPIRFNGVHIDNVKQVFEKNGIKYDVGF